MRRSSADIPCDGLMDETSSTWAVALIDFLESKATVGYGPSALPNGIDAAIIAVAEAHHFGCPIDILHRQRHLEDVLLVFGERMASLTLRHQDLRFFTYAAAVLFPRLTVAVSPRYFLCCIIRCRTRSSSLIQIRSRRYPALSRLGLTSQIVHRRIVPSNRWGFESDRMQKACAMSMPVDHHNRWRR